MKRTPGPYWRNTWDTWAGVREKSRSGTPSDLLSVRSWDTSARLGGAWPHLYPAARGATPRAAGGHVVLRDDRAAVPRQQPDVQLVDALVQAAVLEPGGGVRPWAVTTARFPLPDGPGGTAGTRTAHALCSGDSLPADSDGAEGSGRDAAPERWSEPI